MNNAGQSARDRPASVPRPTDETFMWSPDPRAADRMAPRIIYFPRRSILEGNGKQEALVLDLKYSLVIEATSDANSFGFSSPTLEGFTGVGDSSRGVSLTRNGVIE